MTLIRRVCLTTVALVCTAALGVSACAHAADKKPNILVIWGDDIGIYNISAYNLGGMGYKTPNIDRIAKEGALYTDFYAQQSCTAGRASFILGQHPFRTGLLTIGMPGSPQGIPDWSPTIADLLKARLPHDPAGVPVPAGQQSQRGQHQLRLAEGNESHEALAAARGHSGTEQLNRLSLRRMR